MTDSVTLLCGSCGSSKFAYPQDRQLKDTDVVTCGGCRRQSTVGVVRKQAMEAAKKAITDKLQNSFKNFR